LTVSLIAAVAQNGIIGRNDASGKPDLPWHLPDDFQYFKTTTSGHPIIMGRKSLDALGKPLPKRTNIVVTRNRDFRMPGVTVVHTLTDALTEARKVGDSEIFVIGGAEIYAMALPVANRLYLTEIQRSYEGDTHFPTFDKAEWQEISRRHHPADERHETAFDFVVYERPTA
jgi:dihydrofolate reductase